MHRRQRRDVSSYLDLIDQFADGELTAPEFEVAYLRLMKSETRILGEPVYRILETLFEDVDAYVDRPELRMGPEDLDDEQLRSCAETARRALRRHGFD